MFIDFYGVGGHTKEVDAGLGVFLSDLLECWPGISFPCVVIASLLPDPKGI